MLYLFEKISCVVFRQAMKGKIQCLEIIAGTKAGDDRSCFFLASLCMMQNHLCVCYIMQYRSLADYRVVVGGMGGVVKVFLARTFSELHSFCLADAIPPPKLTRSTSNRSSSAFRRSQSARRPSLRPEVHCAFMIRFIATSC